MNRFPPILLTFIASLAITISSAKAQDTETVTNTNSDTSAGSLGAALQTATSDSANSDTITFSSLFDIPQTIDAYGSVSKSTGETLTIDAPAQLTTYGFALSGGGNYYLGNITLAGGAPYLSISGGSTAYLNNVSVSGTIALNHATLDTVTGLTTSAAVTLAGMDTIDVAAGQTSTFTGIFSGTGTLVSSGSGTLVMGNPSNLDYANTYTGGTQINNGTLESLVNQTNIPALGTGPVAINGAGTLVFSGNGFIGSSGTLTAGGGTLNIATSYGASFAGLTRVAGGGLTIIPSGSATFGSSFNQFVRITTAPTVTNGIVDASIVAASSSSDTSADFLTYSALNGLERATYSTATAITNGGANGTTSTSVFQASSTTNNTVSSPTTLYALKVDSGVTVQGSQITLGGGGNTAGLIINGSGSATPTTISSAIKFASGSEGAVYVGGIGTADYAKITGTVTGSNGLTKNGNGSLELAAADYTGTTTVNGGTLQFDTYENSLTPGLLPTSVINLASTVVYNGFANLNGTINLTADGTIGATGNSETVLNGTINGNGHVLTLGSAAANNPVVVGGMLNNISAFNIAGTAQVNGTIENASTPINVISNSGDLQVNSNATVANPINLSGGLILTSGATTLSGPVTTNLGPGPLDDDDIESYSGTVTLSGTISGTAGLLLFGNGSVSITGSSPHFTGGIANGAGNLDITGSLPQTGVSGGSLSGTGTIGLLSLNEGSKVHPGELGTIGALTASGMQWISDGTPQLQFQLSNTSSASSLLNLGTGTFVGYGLDNANYPFVVDFLGSGEADQDYDLINFGAGNTNLSASDFSATDLGAGLSASFELVTNGNTESLMLDVVPEPRTNALLVAGLLGLAALARRRRG